jgi:hypothetical protein
MARIRNGRGDQSDAASLRLSQLTFPLIPFTNRDGIPNRNCTVLLVSIDV